MEGLTIEGQDKCIFAVSSIPDSQNMYVLGDTFIRNFYSVFNYSTYEVGLAVNTSAPKGTAISGQGLTGWAIACIVLACILLLIIIVFCVTRCIKKRRQK